MVWMDRILLIHLSADGQLLFPLWAVPSNSPMNVLWVKCHQTWRECGSAGKPTLQDGQAARTDFRRRLKNCRAEQDPA